MGKSRTGAGNSCSSLYKCNPNLNTFGGNKKQGITSRVGLDNWDNREIQLKSNGVGRFKLICMNQLGGIGAGHSMFGGRWNKADGMKTCSAYNAISIDYPGTGSTIYYNGNKIYITNADNLTSIEHIFIKNETGSLIIPVKYEGNGFTVLLPETIIAYLKVNDFSTIQHPVSVSINPYQYNKKISTVFSTTPNSQINNVSGSFQIQEGYLLTTAASIECPDTLKINGYSDGHLFKYGSGISGYGYFYYKQDSRTIDDMYRVTCV